MGWPVFDQGFSTPELTAVFTPETRAAAILEFEAALAMALADAGIAPVAEAEAVAAACRDTRVDAASILDSQASAPFSAKTRATGTSTSQRGRRASATASTTATRAAATSDHRVGAEADARRFASSDGSALAIASKRRPPSSFSRYGGSVASSAIVSTAPAASGTGRSGTLAAAHQAVSTSQSGTT